MWSLWYLLIVFGGLALWCAFIGWTMKRERPGTTWITRVPAKLWKKWMGRCRCISIGGSGYDGAPYEGTGVLNEVSTYTGKCPQHGNGQVAHSER